MRPIAFLKGLAVGLGSAVAFAGSLVLHLDTTPARRVAAQATTQILATPFKGRIVVDRIDVLSVATGKVALTARLFDPQGREIAQLEAVRARLDVLALLRSLPGSGAMQIRVRDLDVGPGRLALLRTPDGGLSLADTFAPREPKKENDTPGRPVAVSLAPLTVSGLRVEGDVVPDLRAQVRSLRGSLALDEQTLELEVGALDAEGAMRGVEPVTVRADARAGLPLAEGKRPRVSGKIDLRTRGADATVTARIDDVVDARVIAHASPELAAALSLPVTSTHPVDVDLSARGPLDALAVDGSIKSGPGTIAVSGRGNVPAKTAVATLVLRDVDAHAFVTVAPVSHIDGRIDVDAQAAGPHVKARVHLERGAIAGQETPIVDLDAALDDKLVSAHVVAHEPGTRVEAQGTLDLGAPDKPAHVRVDAKSDDLARLRAIEPGARGAVTVVADLSASLGRQTLSGNVHASVSRFAWGDAVQVRRAEADAEVSGTFESPSALASLRASDVTAGRIRGDRVAAGGMLRVGSLIIDAPYARIERGDTSIKAEAGRVRIGKGVTIDLYRVTGLGGPIEGSAHINASELAVSARGKGVRLEPLANIGAIPDNVKGGGDLDVDLALGPRGAVGHAHVDFASDQLGKAPPFAARVDLDARGQTIALEAHADLQSIGKIDIPRGEVRIDGDPRQPRTWQRAAGNLEVSTDIALADLAARFVDPSELRAEGRARGVVRFARARPGGPVSIGLDLQTQGLVVETPTASLHGAELLVRGNVGATSSSASIEAFDQRGPLLSGRAAIAMGLASRGAFGRAPLHATVVVPARSLDPISIGGEKWGQRTRAAAVVEASGTMADARMSAWVRGVVEGLGSLRVDELSAEWKPGRETLPRGRAKVDALVDLEGVVRNFGKRFESLPKMTGVLDASVEAHRDEGEAMPSARVMLRTKGLGVREPFVLNSTDLRASAELHAATGEVVVSTTAWDREGTLGIVDAKAALDGPITPASLTQAIAHWNHVPMSVRVAVPPRSIDSLMNLADANPASRAAKTRAKRIDGGVAMEASAEGTFDAPKVVVRAYALGLKQLDRRTEDKPNAVKPLDAALYATYDGKRADVGMTVVDVHRTSLQGAGTIVFSSAELAERGETPLIASADVHADRLRIGALPFVGDAVKGDVDAKIMLRGYGEDARLEATIDAKKLTVQRIQFDSAQVRVLAEDGKLAGAVGLAQKDGGWLGAMLRSELRWGSAAVPTLVPDGEVSLDYRADRFRLAGLRPVLRTVLPDVDGRLDGRGRLVREKGTERAEGSIQLRDGTAYVAMLGQQVDDVDADLKLGHGTFVIENARARIDKGEVRVAASGRMAGLVPTGVRARAVIPTNRDLPVYIEGVRYGNVNGEIGLDVNLSSKELRIDADVPRLRFDLAALDPRQVQDLDPAENIEIGVRDRDGNLEEVRLQRLQRGRKQPDAEAAPAEQGGRATTVHVKLGRQVILSQGTMLYVPVGGELDVLVREEMRLRGKVQLGNGGLINLKGRKFRVQNGTITWTENDEPSNPVVIASAQWEAPDKTNVIASFTGPAKTGKLDLRSEPAHTKGEILSLLLFGTTDGRTGGGGGSVAATGATLGGGVAAGGLGRALSKLTDVEIEASVESPDARTTRPEVAVRVRPDVTLQVGYNIAPPAVQRDRWLLTVDWRIAQRWSVQATEGDRGTTILDLLWQYRY